MGTSTFRFTKYLYLACCWEVLQVITVATYLWTFDLYGPLHNGFDVGNSFMRESRMGLGLEIEAVLGPVKWHQAVSQVLFIGARKSQDFKGPTPSHLPKQWICPHQKALRTPGPYQSEVHR